MIVLPYQRPTYPNTRDVFEDGVWLQQCITCGKEGGDCDHSMPEESEDELFDTFYYYDTQIESEWEAA